MNQLYINNTKCSDDVHDQIALQPLPASLSQCPLSFTNISHPKKNQSHQETPNLALAVFELL